MAQRSIPIARTKSLKDPDERKQEELARGVIRRFFQTQRGDCDASSEDGVSDGVPIIPSLDGELVVESSTVGESSLSSSLTLTPHAAAKPKSLALAPHAPLSPIIQSPAGQPSHSQEEDSAIDVSEGQATFVRHARFRHSAVVLPSSPAQCQAGEGHHPPRTAQNEVPVCVCVRACVRASVFCLSLCLPVCVSVCFCA